MQRRFLSKDEFCVKEELKEVKHADFTIGENTIKVIVDDVNETVYVTQKQIGELYGIGINTVNEHINNILEEEELEENELIRYYRIVQKEGNRNIKRNILHYNLDMVLAVGYRIRESKKATAFRKWANGIIKNYLTKGYALNEPVLTADELKWRNLYEEVKALRDKEKDDYALVCELYKKVCPDYDPKVSRKFYGFMQNLFHFAATNHTAAEIIYERADHTQPFMGLQSFAGDKVTKADVIVAKNYLSKDEIKIMHGIVMSFYNVMNCLALKHIVVSTNDFTNRLTKLIIECGCNILCGYGSVEPSDAKDKALVEYSIYSKNQEKSLF